MEGQKESNAIKLNPGIIIQARTQSHRLPDKIILPFYKNESILEIILCRFLSAFPGYPIIVASSTNSKDDRIEFIVRKFPSILLFRGDEDNVIKRFIDAAEFYNINSILRVCSDNLFIDMDLTGTLFLINNRTPSDYSSYILKGDIPVIKSHQGFYTELVSLNALKAIVSFTNEVTYIEHVTNYIYTHRYKFKIHFESAPDILYNLKNIRITIDTKADFENAQFIYSRIIEENAAITYLNVLRIVQSNKYLLNSMHEQIKLNSK